MALTNQEVSQKGFQINLPEKDIPKNYQVILRVKNLPGKAFVYDVEKVHFKANTVEITDKSGKPTLIEMGGEPEVTFHAKKSA